MTFLRVFTETNLFFKLSTEFYRDLLGLTGFYRVLPGFTEFLRKRTFSSNSVPSLIGMGFHCVFYSMLASCFRFWLNFFWVPLPCGLVCRERSDFGRVASLIERNWTFDYLRRRAPRIDERRASEFRDAFFWNPTPPSPSRQTEIDGRFFKIQISFFCFFFWPMESSGNDVLAFWNCSSTAALGLRLSARDWSV